MGAECGMLAARGYTATDDVFGPKGYFDTFLREEQEPRLLITDFGRPFRMTDPGVGFKKYPSNYFTHRGIDAAISLRRGHRLDPADIASVSIAFPALDYVNRPNPKTGLDGKFSVQYTVAVALLDAAVTIDTFTDERRFAPDVEALLPKVELVVDESIPPEFDTMHIRLTVRTTSGTVYRQRVDKLSGMQGVPLEPGELEAKFMGCATRVFETDRATRLLHELQGIEKAENLGTIMTLARGDDA
jgi:aconitate decarboxylase